MPTWLPIDRDYAQVRRRVGIQQRIGEMLTGILPTYVLERNWPGDQLDMWGANGVCSPPLNGNLQSVSLFNQSADQELLVWRVESNFVDGVSEQISRPFQMHIFTPLQTYDPASLPSAIPFFFPWLQPVAPPESARLSPNAFLIAGSNPAIQVVTINGVPTSSIGPILHPAADATSGFFSVGVAPVWSRFWQAGDVPPIRVRPGQRLTVQSLFPAFGNDHLEANFWWSERRFDRGL